MSRLTVAILVIHILCVLRVSVVTKVATWDVLTIDRQQHLARL